MAVVAIKNPKNTSAPGPYMGFALQPIRLCYHLLREPDGTTVGIEYLDDVSIHRADGAVVLEQSKNSIAGKPIGDKSADLWKTFANWGDICETRGLDADHTTFVLYAAAPGQLGNLLLQMHAAIDDGQPKLRC